MDVILRLGLAIRSWACMPDEPDENACEHRQRVAETYGHTPVPVVTMLGLTVTLGVERASGCIRAPME